MKLSFSIQSSKSSSSSKHNPRSRTSKLGDGGGDGGNKREKNPDHSNEGEEANNKEFLTEFDSSQIGSNSRSNNVQNFIPPLQNTNDWRLTNQSKKMKNLAIPLSESSNQEDEQLHFELDASSLGDQDPSSHMAYGLNLRQPTSTIADDHKDPKKASEEGDGGLRNGSSESLLLQKLKDDLNRLPEHKGMEEYEEVPVEGFGAAVLSGYGWYEGRGIGKNAREDVKVKQFEKRTGKEGLGFVADNPKDNTGSATKEQKDKERPNELQIRDGFSVGKSIRIIRGRDAGLKGRILERLGNDWVVLKLSRTDEKVKVCVDDIAELGSREEERCLRELRNIQGSNEDRKCSNKSKMSTAGGGRRDNVDQVEVVRNDGDGVNGGKKEKESKKKKTPWLTSHIRVRIISKDFRRGRFYLKKGKVLDVIDPTTCDIAMDDSEEIIQGVSQDFLETAIPRRGGQVLVLSGKHRGVYGSLVERDLDREVGVVRDADSHELFSVRLEQMAEYIGDPSYLGY